jgi:acetyltransferase-like isoleucine patch superfamily enzyme
VEETCQNYNATKKTPIRPHKRCRLNLILKNPLSEWLVWLARTYHLKRKNPTLDIRYLAVATPECSFGTNNTLHERSLVRGSALGNYTYVGRRARISSTTLGSYCSIGPEVISGLGIHPSNAFVSTHPCFYSLQHQSGPALTDRQYFTEFSDITIGNDVWIGARAIILDGVTIGDGAIVAANSVVTKDVQPYAIVGGVPAKTLRHRFTQETIKKLLAFRWWNRHPDWIKQNFRHFHDIHSLEKLIDRTVGYD